MNTDEHGFGEDGLALKAHTCDGPSSLYPCSVRVHPWLTSLLPPQFAACLALLCGFCSVVCAQLGKVQDSDTLTSSAKPEVGLLHQEYQQASPLGEGLFDANFCESQRRNIWPGLSPDGRKWDEWSPDGEPAMPYNGASDCRPFASDGVINDGVALGMAAFRRGEIRADTVNPDHAELVGPLSAYAHWLVRKRYRKALELEAELSLQYTGEYGYCVAFVGWERELSKARRRVTLEELAALGSQMPEFQSLAPMILDETLDDTSAEAIRVLYRIYVQSEMVGFFEDEMEDDAILNLHLSTAKKYVRELRKEGKCDIPMPYVCKNRPLVFVARPYHEFLCARGTTDLQSSSVLFLRRTFTVAELDAKKTEGWDPDWVDAAKKTKGSLSMWGNPSGQPTITSSAPSKLVGGVRWYRLTQNQYDRVEVVYAYRRATDENGVTEIYQTIFSPHFTKDDYGKDSAAKHELLDYAHGLYPFVVFKREQLGRGLVETRGVPEIESTSERMEKEQLDMLFNRAQLETLPPIGVPKLGGVDYRLGPGAQVPVKKSDEFKNILNFGPPPTLALELVKLLGWRRDHYFGRFNPEIPQPITSTKQEKMVGDFFSFWGEVFKHMFALTLQYNPQEIIRVTGQATAQLLGQMDPRGAMQDLDFDIAFDVMELDREYLVKKFAMIDENIVPGDVGGEIDRNALTHLKLQMVDSRIAAKVSQNRGAASQKIFDDVLAQTIRCQTGNEASYVENDPTASAKLQFLQQIVQNNPKLQEALEKDERVKETLENYAKNLQMSVDQEQNKQVGRIGVKQLREG